METILLITGAALWCCALMLLNRDISTPVKAQVLRSLREWKQWFVAYCGLKWKAGFTLIELAIVLVIIGLIVGGVLVGQELIRTASVRAQVTQIEKFRTAVNTFYGKYGYLPGDIKDPEATSFGFVPRGPAPCQGNGDGRLMGGPNGAGGGNQQAQGETVVFWNDLSKAGLIEGSFTAASNTVEVDVSGTSLDALFPVAKLSSSLHIYAYGGGVYDYGAAAWLFDGYNYYGLSSVTNNYGTLNSDPGIRVADAAAIDTKIDDGLPLTGSVIAKYENYALSSGGYSWASGAGVAGPPDNSATSASPTTCYDNGNVSGATQHYSVEVNNGGNLNCALSFRFQ